MISPAGHVPFDERIARVPVAEHPRRVAGEAQEVLLTLAHAKAARELFPFACSRVHLRVPGPKRKVGAVVVDRAEQRVAQVVLACERDRALE